MANKSPKERVKMGAVPANVRRHVGRVNQKMIDQMIRMRREGLTQADIARRLGASERTVRRHTEGVSPQLVHAADETRVDLLKWGALQMRAIQQRWRLSVTELDICMKRLRTVVSELDDMTVEQLERDPQLRVQFLKNEIWPPAHEKIDDLRLDQDVPPRFSGA
jgi:predicted transcriptional regulator